MKRNFYALILAMTGIFFMMGSTAIAQDNPNIDRIPDDFIQHQQNRAPQPSSVITIDGYDNYYLGVDFAEGHISENPQQPGEYFVAFNIDDIHYTYDGSDWSNGNVSWGGYNIRGDVLTAYDGDGNLYYENMYGSSIQGCVVVKSTDNGATWTSPVVAISGNDKNWMTADQTDGPYSNYVYTVMTNNGSGNFARSTNQGTSFQNTHSFSTQALPGMMVCIGADGATDGGSVYVVTNSGGSFNSTYTFYESNDGGQTFAYKSAQSFSGYVGSDVNGRNSVQNMRTRPYPFITADNSNGPNRGRLYLIYASNMPAGNGNKPDIFSRYSDDGGASWSSAVTVNDDMPSVANNQWHPATWCDYETGRLYVQWMDTRDTPTGDSALIYATYSDDGGMTFAPNHAISNVKMKINCNTCGAGGTPRYQGDYNGIVSNPITSMPTWSDFRNGNFKTFTAYYPDYGMLMTPTIGQATGGTATFQAEIPSVKGWTETVTFSADVEVPSTGSFNIDFPAGMTLSSFPGSLDVEVTVIGNVPAGLYDITITGTGPNGTPVHHRVGYVEVVPSAGPTAEFSASPTTVCQGNSVDFMDTSTGDPTSWSWTFPGGTPATSTDQNPTVVYDTPGMYDVTLEATNSAGSDMHTKTDYIEVLAGPTAPMSNDEEACIGEAIPDLTAVGADLKWYDDAGLTNLVFSGSPFATGQTDAGMYTYYVTQTDMGCESAATMVVLTIHERPTVTLEAFAPLCIDAPLYGLVGGSPAGGTYSGTGVDAGVFDPSVAGAGMHDITYIYTDANGCSNSAVQPITVNDLPVVTFAALPGVCVNEPIFTLSGGMPEGGEYTGTGVSTGMFKAEVAGVGSHEITYTYFDGNGCINSAVQSIVVNEIPHPNIGPDQDVCADSDITLDATSVNAASYEWYPGGQTTAAITVDSTGVGLGTQMYIVHVTSTDACVNSDTVMITYKDCTGLGELAGVNDIRLYPNPAQGIVTLQVNTSKQLKLNVKVYNNRGLVVYEEAGLNLNNSELIRMDLSSQPAGIYLVMVYNEQGKWVEKLVIRN